MDPIIPITLVNWLVFAVMIAIATAAAFGGKALVSLVKANLNATYYETLRKYAKTYVAALIQDPTLKGLATAEKKERAMMWLIKKGAELGIELSIEETSRIIEEAVYLLKKIPLEEIDIALSE